MPAESGLFRNRAKPFMKMDVAGQFGFQEQGINNTGGAGDFGLLDYATFSFCTGSNNGLYPSPQIPDITNVNGTTVLMPATKCPVGMRPYLTRLDIDVQGAVNWGNTTPTSGIPTFSVTDTSSAQNPLAVLPFNALKGLTELTFPDTETTIPLLLGPGTVTGPVGPPVTTWTYVQSTGLLTAGAAIFPSSTTCMVGTPVSIVDGTGKGQTAMVQTSASNSTTVLYLGTAAFPVAPDATSVLAVWWQPLSAYTSTTSITLPSSATYGLSAFDNGYNVVGVFGSGVGSSRPIQNNNGTNNAVLTLAYALNNAMSSTATLATLSMLQITTDNQLCGAIDMCIGDKWASAAINSGIQVTVNNQGGTSPIGSPVRIYGEGYWAY